MVDLSFDKINNKRFKIKTKKTFRKFPEGFNFIMELGLLHHNPFNFYKVVAMNSEEVNSFRQSAKVEFVSGD